MKKRIILSLLLMTFSCSIVVDAEESKNYDSKAGIGFYGEYRLPEKTSSTSESKVPATNELKNTDNKKIHQKLPNTGEHNQRYIGLAGWVIGLIVLIYIYKLKKKRGINK